MALDLSNPRRLYDGMREHVGHKIACVGYGPGFENVAIECETCSVVLVDQDATEPEDEGPDTERAEALDELTRLSQESGLYGKSRLLEELAAEQGFNVWDAPLADRFRANVEGAPEQEGK